MKNKPASVAIDGPAASGKTTLGKRLAEKLEYLIFDTGVMYRAVAWAALHEGIQMEDGEALGALAERLDIDVRIPSQPDGRICDVVVDGVDVTWEIRKPEVEHNVSVVAAYAGVRAALTRQQRKIGLRGGVVMVGRDIGTVVLPEAPLKIYLEASPEERARRRYEELRDRKVDVTYEDILATTLERDRIDTTRSVAPLVAADDAVIINSDNMNEDQVLECALALIS